MATTTWQPSWWNQSHGNAWERVKEAVRRDWEQTKHDLHLKGGHELNQDVVDTLKQATGREEIPADDRPNPPKVIGTLHEAELPMGYGYSAHQKYGDEHPFWNERIEAKLRAEWEQANAGLPVWNHVHRWVRHGYEYEQSKKS